MKKLILVLVIGLMAMAVNAQFYTKIGVKETFNTNRITTADSVKNTGVKTYVLEVGRHNPYTYDIQIKLDTITTPAASSGVSVQLVGKKFEDDAWSNIGSAVVWKSLITHEVGADTTINWNATTAVRWRYVGVKLTGAGTHQTKIRQLNWKLWNE
jgi:hypothetical protein